VVKAAVKGVDTYTMNKAINARMYDIFPLHHYLNHRPKTY